MLPFWHMTSLLDTLLPYPDNKCCWLCEVVIWNGSLNGHVTGVSVYIEISVVSSFCKETKLQGNGIGIS